jgi:hypothetical protein
MLRLNILIRMIFRTLSGAVPLLDSVRLLIAFCLRPNSDASKAIASKLKDVLNSWIQLHPFNISVAPYFAGAALLLNPPALCVQTYVQPFATEKALRSTRVPNVPFQISRAPYPFWGCPPSRASTYLLPKKQPPPAHFATPLPEKREAESRCSAQSTWKLYTTGSVGSQVSNVIFFHEFWNLSWGSCLCYSQIVELVSYASKSPEPDLLK